ncbi:hypothetical protein N1851_015599 [Merluccius polli]|uniref:Uncharacterized protein n=1 Tax=Merluccius polli TaxID=89951 RepID=A0AA47MSV3_MERPO|nr:hypothetical protein N1851_015599 [Merluccius polli]
MGSLKDNIRPQLRNLGVIFDQTMHLDNHYRIHFKVLTFTFKALHGQAPAYITEIIHPYSNPRSLRSADQHLLVVPRTRLKTKVQKSETNLRHWWLIEIQLQPLHHIVEVSRLETHNVFVEALAHMVGVGLGAVLKQNLSRPTASWQELWEVVPHLLIHRPHQADLPHGPGPHLHFHRRVGEVERKVVQEVRQVGGGPVDHRQGVARAGDSPLPPVAPAGLGERAPHELLGEGAQLAGAQGGQLVGVRVQHAAAPVGLPLLVHEAAVPVARLQAHAADRVVLVGEERRLRSVEVGTVVRMRRRLALALAMLVVVERRMRGGECRVGGGRGEVGRRSRAHGLHLHVVHDAAELPATGVVVVVVVIIISAAMPPLPPPPGLLQEVLRQQRLDVLVAAP